MRSSCAVCSLAVALCLVICVSANTKVTQEDATREMTEAQRTVKRIREIAQTQFDNAKGLLDKVELSKRDAQEAASKSHAAETDNEEAKKIATKIQSLSDEVAASYSEVKEKLEEAVKSLTPLLAEANTLEGKPEIEITANPDSAEDYSVTNGKAVALKAQADALKEQIDTAIGPIAGVGAKAEKMETKTKKAQLKDAHISAIIAVAKIKSMLGNGDTTIGQIEEKEREVSGIVEEMQKDCTNELIQSNEVIKEQCQIANDALKSAQGAVKNAKSAKAAIQTQKDTADEALKKVKAENQEVSDAQKEVRKAEECVSAAQLIVTQLNNLLMTADNSMANANGSKENLKTALSTATSATHTEQSVTNPKVNELQNSVSAAVSTIQSIVGEADGTLQETKNNKEAVHNIVEEMKKLSTTEFIEANQNIKMLYSKADDALTDATSAVKNAEQAKTDMTEQKQKADDALSSVATAKDVETAQKEVNTANACVNQVKQFAATLKSALQTAKESVTSANDAKQKLQTDLLTASSATHTEQSSTHSQVKTLQDSVSADVKAIQTMMGEAVSILQTTENHKQTVHDIVQEMQKLTTTANIESNDINELCKNAEGELKKATGAVEKVKTEKGAIRQEKVIADAALIDVNAATAIDKAQQQSNTATSCLAKVKKNLVQVRSALHTAKNSVAKANELKQTLRTILSTTTTAPRTKEVKEAEKSDLPVADGTESDQKNTTIKPTITNTEQATSKDSLNQGDSSAEKLKNTLIKGSQNVPTTALTGEKAPAPGAKNDSAMTVSVPLLVALIASAVFQ